MKLWTIFCFEFAYQARRFSTGLNLAVLLAFTLLMNLVTTPGDGVFANNTFHITAIAVIGGLIWLVMGASVAGEAAARDVRTGMHPLAYSMPMTKLDYLGGRFLAALAVNALLILSLPLGVLLSFYLPGMDEGGMLPFRPAAYLDVYFLIALPGVFWATALQFSAAALSRQATASYGASLLLALVAQVAAVAVAKLFGNWDLVKLLDPVGVAGIVGGELSTWTPAEKNTRLVTWEGMFLWNRLLWLVVAGLSLWFTYRRFHFDQPIVGNSRWNRFRRKPKTRASTTAQTRVRSTGAGKLIPVQRSFGFATASGQMRTIAWASFGRIARNPVGWTLVAAIALVSAVFGNRIMTQLGIPLLPTTPQVLAYLATSISNIGTPWVVMPLLIIYFSGELVWREREAGLSEIADAAPVPGWVLFAGKFMGLGLIILLWMALLMASGIGMQLGLGYSKIDAGLYIQVLFGVQLADYLLFALLALAVHVVVNQKYTGYLVMLAVFGLMAFPSLFGVEHKLLIYGADPGWWYTDMRGFGTTLQGWLWFKAYWGTWGLLLAVLASLFWVSGREQGWKHRLKVAKRRFTPVAARFAGIALMLILILGGFIFYNTNGLNKYRTSSDLNEQKAAYERCYSRFSNTPQPQLRATKMQVEIYPDGQQADIRAVYTLVNKDALAIDSIHLVSMPGIVPAGIQFNRPAAGVLTNKKLGYYIYALRQPLRPGDSLQVSFAIHYKQRGFRNEAPNPLVVKNGTYFTNYDLLPAIGYQRYRELRDPVLRKKWKLAARPELPSLYDREARRKGFGTDQATFEAIVSTALNEVAVAPGVLQQTWTKGNRRYFHYKTDAPIGGEYAVLSGHYAVRKSNWQHVAIRIYHHPDHAQNIGRMLRSVQASLAYYTEQFGPYPYGYITVVERAGSGGGASSDASMINYGEQYALMHPDDGPDGFDLPYYILAHEVAHQWWGMARLTPANVEGAGVLIEGLAVYSGMQVLEKNYGRGHLQQYINYLHDAYEMPRSRATPSLLQANEEFLYYRKAGLALYALDKYAGQQKVNGALRSLFQRTVSGALTLPTTLDLYQELQKVIPDSLKYLLSDLFQKNTYWRLKTKQLAATQIDTGSWQATLTIQAQKVVIDSKGQEHEVPMNDWLEVGLYEKDKGSTEPLYLQQHRIRSGEQTIKVTVPRKPVRGGIDPANLMIDLRRDDNMVELGG